MTIRHHNPWESSPSHSSLVHLPKQKYSLSASVAGPRRRYTTTHTTCTTKLSPLLIFFTGGGTLVAFYIKVRDALSTTVRTLFYDRAGYDHSGTSPSNNNAPLTAEQNAIELDELLDTIDLRPPYILVDHSYGGIVQRTFLDRMLTKHGDPASVRDVVPGMVLFDAGTELLSALFKQIPSADLIAVYKNVDFADPAKRHEIGFSLGEWQAWLEAAGRTANVLRDRTEDTHGSMWELAKMRQFDTARFGDGVLDVVSCNLARTWQALYDEGVRTGGGTEEERKGARLFIEKCDVFFKQVTRVQLDLVDERGVKRYRFLGDLPHEGIAMQPMLVVQSVEWVLEQLGHQQSRQ